MATRTIGLPVLITGVECYWSLMWRKFSTGPLDNKRALVSMRDSTRAIGIISVQAQHVTERISADG